MSSNFIDFTDFHFLYQFFHIADRILNVFRIDEVVLHIRPDYQMFDSESDGLLSVSLLPEQSFHGYLLHDLLGKVVHVNVGIVGRYVPHDETFGDSCGWRKLFFFDFNVLRPLVHNGASKLSNETIPSEEVRVCALVRNNILLLENLACLSVIRRRHVSSQILLLG